MGVSVLFSFVDTVVNSNHIVMADIVAIALCWKMLCDMNE